MATDQDWSRSEIELLVDDYLDMLRKEITGEPLNKTSHRNALKLKLENRSDGAIEFKHCNVSAELRDMGSPIVEGYQPRSHTQGLLAEIIEEKWDGISDVMKPPAQRYGTWLADVASCISNLETQFTLAQVYDYVDVLSVYHPNNKHVHDKIRQALQRLRDVGLIEFLDRSGRYRKADGFPGDVSLLEISAKESEEFRVVEEDILDDPDERTLRAVKIRQEGARFRRLLLRAYDSRCAITAHGPVEVLEAAHIRPHTKGGINSLDNGLLLRADIHALFDKGLLWIDPDSLNVCVGQKLKSSSYSHLEGKPLRPRLGNLFPNRLYLAERAADVK